MLAEGQALARKRAPAHVSLIMTKEVAVGTAASTARNVLPIFLTMERGYVNLARKRTARSSNRLAAAKGFALQPSVHSTGWMVLERIRMRTPMLPTALA